MTKTEKLYETNSHLSVFEATVQSCIPDGEGYLVVLDRTAFFPEGGGQGCDVGKIGDTHVCDVQVENGIVYHRTAEPVQAGVTVTCEVDMSVRFPRMQCHSGEHIVSGLVHTLYGFENVGFHLGDSDMTLDFSGFLDGDMLDRVEWLANEAVSKNVPVNVSFPASEELKSLEYRSKLDLTENVRIVEIEGYDRCACCAPHVSRTGEIGIIKFLDRIRYKGGTRLHVQCGFRALEDYRRRYTDTSEIARMLSVKQEECLDAVTRLTKELSAAEHRCEEIIVRALVERVNAEPIGENAVYFVPAEFSSGIRDMANAAVRRCEGIAAVFAGESGAYTFVMMSRNRDVREASKDILAKIGGRGGGTSEMVRGSAGADEETIRSVFSSL